MTSVTLSVLVLVLTLIECRAQDAPQYTLTWLGSPDGPSEVFDSKVFDVNADGVAVGQIKPLGLSSQRYGVVFAPDKAVQNLETLAAAQLPAGWRLTAGVTISDDLVIGGDVLNSAGSYRTFAAKLVEDGDRFELERFKIFPEPPGTTRVFIEDASETGLLLLEVNTVETYLWRPAADWVMGFDLPFLSNINNKGQTASGNFDTLRLELLKGESFIHLEEDPTLTTMAVDIGEDGSAVGSMQDDRDPDPVPARWTSDFGWIIPQISMEVMLNSWGTLRLFSCKVWRSPGRRCTGPFRATCAPGSHRTKRPFSPADSKPPLRSFFLGNGRRHSSACKS